MRIARTPLYLNLLVAVLDSTSTSREGSAECELLEQGELFRSFVENQLDIFEDRDPHKSQQYLSSLALQLAKHNQTQFLVEYMQPDWLRTILWVDGKIPFRLVRFLNEAAREKMLHRIGGTYSFLHPSLQQYFCERTRRVDDRREESIS